MTLQGIWNDRKEKGFTLVELLVVIAIIGVLATLVLLQLGTARGRARDTKRIADVNQIRSAVEQFYDDSGTYPALIDKTNIGKFFSSGEVPTDPLGTAVPYKYCVGAAKKSFQIAAELEQKAAALTADSDLDNTSVGATACVNGALDTACTSAADDCLYDQGTRL